MSKIKGKKPLPPQYRMLNTLLPTGVVEKTIFETLDMYLRGEDVSESPLVQWGRKTLKRGAWWHGIQKASPKDWPSLILKRQQKVIDLYLDIKNNGYNGSEISIFFDADGNVHTYDGYHRLNIMKYLGMEIIVNCRITPRKSDFPLLAVVMGMNNGKNLYQPCDDSRFKDFNVWRRDSPQRLRFICENIKGATVLDVGCNIGYFSRELTKLGHRVTALDTSPKNLSVARYLSTINSLNLDYHQGKWQDHMEGRGFDSVLFLSVFHHDILRLGVDEAFKQLEKFKGRTKQIFFESPTSSKKVKWLDKDRKDTYNFTEKEFASKIEAATEMTVTKTWHGIRPIFLLEA